MGHESQVPKTGDYVSVTLAQSPVIMLRHSDGSVRVVASDAHNLTSRPPVLSRAHAFISQRWGADLANDLMLRNPRLMLGMTQESGVPA